MPLALNVALSFGDDQSEKPDGFWQKILYNSWENLNRENEWRKVR